MKLFLPHAVDYDSERLQLNAMLMSTTRKTRTTHGDPKVRQEFSLDQESCA